MEKRAEAAPERDGRREAGAEPRKGYRPEGPERSLGTGAKAEASSL